MTSKSAITPSLSGRIALIVPGRAAEHPLRLEADRVHVAGRLVDRDHRRLAEHDAAPAHVDERVGGAEIDGHVPTAEAREVVEDAHRRPRPLYLARFRPHSSRSAPPCSTRPGTCCSRGPATCRRRRRRRSCSRSRSRCRSRSIWWSAEPSVWPYALASTLLEVVYVVGARVRLPDDRRLVRLPADPRPRAGADADRRGRAARARRLGAPRSRGVLLVAAGVVLVRGARRPAATRRALARRGDDRRLDRRVHARRPRRHPARRRADLLRARARRAVPRLPAARRPRADPARARPGDRVAAARRTSARSRSACSRSATAAGRAGARRALVVDRDRDAARGPPAGRARSRGRRVAGSVLVFAGVALARAL